MANLNIELGSGDCDLEINLQTDSAGSGSGLCVTVSKPNGEPVYRAHVRISNDREGCEIIRSGFTNSAGEVELDPDPGVYWLQTFVGKKPFSDIQKITVI